MLAETTDQLVQRYLIVEGTLCSPRHCKRNARFSSIIQEPDKIVGAYVCPENYVSRIVYFSSKPDEAWFENFLRKDLGGGSRIRAKDIRKATRHGWELGREAERELTRYPNGLVEFYWTFYPQSDEEKTKGNFVCERCGKLFVKPNSSPGRICQRHGSC